MKLTLFTLSFLLFSFLIAEQNEEQKIFSLLLKTELKNKEVFQEIEFSFNIKLPLKCKGASLILLPKKFKEKIDIEDWAEPNLKKTLAFGFDTENLPPKVTNQQNMFFGKGANIYNRPQREVSIHYDGKEYANSLSNIEFRDHVKDSASVKIKIIFVQGGVKVNLFIKNLYSQQTIYNNFFIPHVKPYQFDVFSSHKDFMTNFRLIKQVVIKKKYSTDFFIVQGFDKKKIRWENGITNKKEQIIQFPKTNITRLHRVIFEFEIHSQEKEFWDGWDRLCSFFIQNNKGEKIEIARFITPYNLAGKWFLDVTDFYLLFKDKKILSTNLQNWFKKKQFLMSTRFYFYLGEEKTNLPKGLIPLGSKELKIGNPKIPVAKLPNEKIIIKSNFSRVKLKMFITGHGYMEFVPIEYFVKVGDTIYGKELSNEDCYLNPVRPQYGTWKFDRSGWCPGTTVESIEIDITDQVKNNSVEIEHIIAKYIHNSRDKQYNGMHFISRAIIIY